MYDWIFHKVWIFTVFAEGDNKKEREQELKMMMKRLEAKYAALQIVPVISKLGTPKVRIIHLKLNHDDS